MEGAGVLRGRGDKESPSELNCPISSPCRPAPGSSTSTETKLQSALKDDSEMDCVEADAGSPLKEDRRSLSWPGCLPNHHISFPTTTKVFYNTDKAQFKAKTPFSKPVPLWALGPSAVKPSSLPLPSSLSAPYTTSSAASKPITTPSVIYNMIPSQGVGLHQPLLTPLLTIVQPGVLASAAGQSVSQPVIVSPTKSLNLPSLTLSPGTASVSTLPPRRESNASLSSSQTTSYPEPSTGQAIMSPVRDVAKPLGQTAPRTLASIPPSELTPQYMELKAFAEEFKNKRIRLGYTQGAVGQSLAKRGYSNFAQSTISRFEQMQLSATNAAAIKLVLEKWLQETECPNSTSSSTSDTPVIASRKRKKRAVFTPQTKSTLDEFFRQNPRPNRQTIESIAQQLDLLPEEVRVWFCNKRQKQKQNTGALSYPPDCSPTTSFAFGKSPSPKQSTPTNFTIEEMSKSSANSSTSSSPVLLASPFTMSPPGRIPLSNNGGMFPVLLPSSSLNPLPQFTTQTRA